MPITRKFSDTIEEQLRGSPSFRRAYLRGTINCFLSGDLGTGKTLLADYVAGTIGFAALGQELGYQSKSLIRMLNGKASYESTRSSRSLRTSKGSRAHPLT